MRSEISTAVARLQAGLAGETKIQNALQPCNFLEL